MSSTQLQACDRCHLRKSRCNKGRPSCLECRRANASCVYTDRNREPLVRKSQLDAVERCLKQAEAKNRALSSDLSKARAERSSSTVSSNQEAGSSLSVPLFQSQDQNDAQGRNQVIPADVMSEVSLLVSNAARGRNFLGSTSGVLFAKLVRESIDVTGAQGYAAQGFTDPATATKLGGRSTAELRSRRDALPPADFTRQLVHRYLAHDHLAYPFLLPSFILSVLEKVYHESSYYEENHFGAFVLDMVLAVANISVYKYNWQTPGAESHYLRAMIRIEDVLQTGSLESLQAILLLCQYQTGSSAQDTSTSLWHLVGTAVRIAYELGLHHESSYAIPSNLSGPELVTKIKDQELRRRCYWSVFCMDRVVSITLGRPLAINLEDVDVKLPSTQHEEILDEGVSPQDRQVPRTPIFIHIIEYRLLCGRIMRSLHGLRPGKNSSESDMYALRDALLSELDQWWANTTHLRLPTTGDSTWPHLVPTFQSTEWYEVLYRNAQLMSCRPSPMLADVSKDPMTLEKIFFSSKQAIMLYASLHRSKKINYSWVTLHSVFMADLSYIYAVSRHFRERRRQSPIGAMLMSDPSTIEIVHDTRACSNVLVAVSERWNSFRHCHEVFDRLSDAVLKDSIKLHTSHRNVPISQAAVISVPVGLANGVNRVAQSHEPFNHGGTVAWLNDSGLNNEFDTGASPLVVDSVFRNCYDVLQDMYQHHNNDPVVQLSQDWLGYLDGFDQFLPNQIGQTMNDGFTQ